MVASADLLLASLHSLKLGNTCSWQSLQGNVCRAVWIGSWAHAVVKACTATGPPVDIEVTQKPPAEASAGAAPAAAAGSAVPVDGAAAGTDPGEAAATAVAGAGAGLRDAAAAQGASERGGSAPLREADRWRWVLVSFKLLPGVCVCVWTGAESGLILFRRTFSVHLDRKRGSESALAGSSS